MLAMDFERVLRALLERLRAEHIRYAALGGFALGVLKVPRTTHDLDFLVHRDDLTKLDTLLRALGYQQRAKTENVAHYTHADAAWGALDCLLAFRQFSIAMLQRAQALPIFDGSLTVKVLQPEDVIGFKIQAMANNPLRARKELVDIESLMAYYGQQLDWRRIREYFDLFELSHEGKRLQERFGNAE